MKSKKERSKGNIIWLGTLVLFLLAFGCKKPAEEPKAEPKTKPMAEAPAETAPSAEPAPAPEGAPSAEASQPSAGPARAGDPALFIFYQAVTPTAGREIQSLNLKVGEETAISVQALDKNGLDTGACPVNWKADSAVLSFTPVEGNCKANKVKALKATDNLTLTVIYKGAKGNEIPASLKGTIK